ncbi:MAG: hypothetical protein F9K23_16060 [Bacteroidetes bacterium]|nr:MAG: hypothetical protein F9K23_16060 [Bacteroidota bacterium]
MKVFYTALLAVFIPCVVMAQDKLLVSEGSIKIGAFSEEVLYFGFAENDKIVFSFSEENRKEIKEVEVAEYPSTSRYTDYKESSAKEKIILVNKEGVYGFRFTNGAITKRIVKYTIERIPASAETQKFNTTVKWITTSDTIWKTYTKNVIVAYDTTYTTQVKREAISTTQAEELIMDKTERVHSITNPNPNKTSIFFTLPKNQKSEYETKTIVAWAYWIGVGQEAGEAWSDNANSVSKLVNTTTATVLTPLGALAIGIATELIKPTTGEDIEYALTDEANRNLFLTENAYRFYDGGKGVASYKKETNPNRCHGNYYICLHNDNIRLGLDVNVKVSAIVETVKYEDKHYKIPIVTPRFEKQIFSDPVITTHTLPVVVK